MFVWFFWLGLAVLVIIGIGVAKERGRARTRLNNEGWPRPFSRDDHRRKEEE